MRLFGTVCSREAGVEGSGHVEVAGALAQRSSAGESLRRVVSEKLLHLVRIEFGVLFEDQSHRTGNHGGCLAGARTKEIAVTDPGLRVRNVNDRTRATQAND